MPVPVDFQRDHFPSLEKFLDDAHLLLDGFFLGVVFSGSRPLSLLFRRRCVAEPRI